MEGGFSRAAKVIHYYLYFIWYGGEQKTEKVGGEWWKCEGIRE